MNNITTKEMFDERGIVFAWENEYKLVYRTCVDTPGFIQIAFDKLNKSVNIEFGYKEDIKDLHILEKAINKQIEELGWYE